MNIVFLGTPDFAVASLEALLKAGLNVVGVVTAPDKPAGRGMKLQMSAVKQCAVRHGIPVLQPEKLKDPEFLNQLDALKADLQVVVAFRMLPELVWNRPQYGTINVHASLLPQYRGAAPINWAIINGESETGVTTFKLKHAIDTGNILLQTKVAIQPDETAGSLHDKLMVAGADLLVKTIESLQNGTLIESEQTTDEHIQHAPKIFTNDCAIQWLKPGKEIDQLVRGLSPYPAAFSFLQGKRIKIFKVAFHESQTASLAPNEGILRDGRLFFTCADGEIEILDLQMEGKARMSAKDFLRGWRHSDSHSQGFA
jgi:methionyl-tRNA formyltransferase